MAPTYFILLIFVFVNCLIARSALLADSRRFSAKFNYVYRKKLIYGCLFLSSAALISISGLRDYVGTDFRAYISLYEIYGQVSFLRIFRNSEPIVPAIGKICNIFFGPGNYQSMFFTLAVLTIGLYLLSTYRESKDYLFVTLLFIFVGCWHGTFNGVRQYLGCTVIFLGRRFIFERKFKQYLAVVIVAYLCHQSAIVFLGLYFLARPKFSYNMLFLVALVSVALALSYNYIGDVIGWLHDSEFEFNEYSRAKVSIQRVAVGCCPALLGLWLLRQKQLNKVQIFYLYMMIANAATRLAMSGSAYFSRLGAYPGTFIPLAMSCFSDAFPQKYKNTMRFGILVLYFAYWTYDMTHSHTLADYHWIFEYEFEYPSWFSAE